MARILIIDDEIMVRLTLRQFLEKAGHKVVEADNGEKGLKAFQAQAADLEITDIIMPDKEGIETILDLKKQAPDLPVIAISGGGRIGSTDVLEIAKKMGASHILPKPFGRDKVLALVNECLA